MLSSEEVKTLRLLARSSASVYTWRGVQRIILLSAAGKDNTTIASELAEAVDAVDCLAPVHRLAVTAHPRSGSITRRLTSMCSKWSNIAAPAA